MKGYVVSVYFRDRHHETFGWYVDSVWRTPGSAAERRSQILDDEDVQEVSVQIREIEVNKEVGQ